MDFCSLAGVALILYFSICLAILFLADSDIVTFIHSYYGKQPEEVFGDKVVWVTGSSSGIGEGIAKELAKCHAKIVLSARRKDELDRVKAECLAINKRMKSDDILVLPLDMTDYSSHEPAFKKVISHFGKLDILISNAGRSQRANWVDIQLEVDKAMFELNVFSIINLNRIALKYFLENKRGQLAITTSIAGKGYFESLRNEIGGKVPITMLCPGPTFSGFLKEAFTDKDGVKYDQDVRPTDRRMTAERCAHLSLVGIANQQEESWMGLFPTMLLTYFVVYQPYLAHKVMKLVAKSGIAMKLRDSK